MNDFYKNQIREDLKFFTQAINNGGKASIAISYYLDDILLVKNKYGLTYNSIIEVCELKIKIKTFGTTLNRAIKKRSDEKNTNVTVLTQKRKPSKDEIKTSVLTKNPETKKPSNINNSNQVRKPQSLKFDVNDWGDSTMLKPELESSQFLFNKAEKCGLEPDDFLGLESYKDIRGIITEYEKQLNIVFKNPRRDFYKKLNILTEDELKKHYFKKYKLSYDD